MTVRILLADDHKIVRDGLRALLAKEPGMEVVGEVDTGRRAVQAIRTLAPDIAVVDIAMPELNGIDATRQIVQERPQTRVIALSMHSDKRFVAEMLKAGASGYLLKDCAFEQLADAVRAVMSGQVYLCSEVAGVVVSDYVRRLSDREPMGEGPEPLPLSPREREVLQLLAEGRSTKQVASLLNLSVKTIESHRRQMMDKLGVDNLAGLVKIALREGLTTLED